MDAVEELRLALEELRQAEAELERAKNGEPARRTTRAKSKPKATTRRHPKRVGDWRTEARVPDDDNLVRVLPAMYRHRVDQTPCVMYDQDPFDRHSCSSCNGEKLASLRNKDRIETIAALMRRGDSMEAACAATTRR